MQEKKALRIVSRKAGCALLAVCALQLAVSPLVFLRPRLPAISDALWYGLMLLLSSLTLLGGALVGKKLFGITFFARETPFASFAREKHSRASLPDSTLLVIAGAALCMAGNFATVLVERLAGQAGIEFLGGPELVAPQSSLGILLALLTTGLLPAVTEEILLRGVILPPLRRFGDGFAVVCTAALFALLHQNMVQAPMAFVSGLALGWVYVRGGRLALPVLVHLWNNAAAVLLMLLPERAEYIYLFALLAAGLLSLMFLYARRPKPKGIACGLPAHRRASNFFFGSVAMVLALGYFVAVIVLNTRVGGQ